MIGIELEEGGERSPELNLWKAVLSLAFSDALCKNESRPSAVLKSKAHRWFMFSSRDFKDVCSYAGYDGDYVKSNYNKLVENKEIRFTPNQLKHVRSYWVNVSKKKSSLGTENS